jgi:hypothetical protein
VEVESLHSVINVLADFMRALMGHREERLLSAWAQIRAAIERDIRRGVAVVVTMA